jgi:hypothetical protein
MDPNRQMITESARKKWQPILEHKALPEIKDSYKKTVTTILLENQERALRESYQGIAGTGLGNIGGFEAGATSTTGTGIDSFDPIMISLVRRAMPNLMAYDIAGVQPMNGPTGLIFAMKTKYQNAGTGTIGARAGNASEALFKEANTSWSGETGAAGDMGDIFQDDAGSTDGRFEAGRGFATSKGEKLGDGTNNFNEMSFTIEKTAVTAKTRALKAEYTTELAQDLKAVHGLDAETELANILSTEIMFEINRELVRQIYDVAKLGCQQADLAGKATGGGLNGAAGGGTYNLELDSDGRWSAEKFRGLTFQIERECNVVGAETRRGKGNFIITSPDVAAALSMSGLLDFSPAFSGALNTDVNGNTFAGTLHGGRIKVYIDPYSMPTSTETFSPINFVCVGYKGTSPYDAGLFYCPYVPLQMVRAVDTGTFQPKIGFKTRYGMVSNPYVLNGSNLPDAEVLTRRRNQYYRIFRVDNLHGNDASFGGAATPGGA